MQGLVSPVSMEESARSRPKTPAELVREALLRASIAIGIVILVISAIGYRVGSEVTQSSYRETLSVYIAERAARERSFFSRAEIQLEVLREKFLENYDARVDDAHWRRIAHRTKEGAWRPPLDFDAKSRSGVFVASFAKLTPELRAKVSTAERVTSQLGPLLLNPFANAYISFAEGATVGFWPIVPHWTQTIPHDHDLARDPYFAAASPANNPQRKLVWTGAYKDPGVQRWMLSALLPIYDAKDLFVGVIGQDFYLTDMLQRIVTESLPGAYNVLVRSDGEILAHPGFGEDPDATTGPLVVRAADHEEVAEALAAILKDGRPQGTVALSDSQAVGGFARLDEVGAYVVTVIPAKQIARHAQPQAWIVLIFGILSLIVELWILRRLMLPLAKLVDQRTEELRSAKAKGLEAGRLATVGVVAEGLAHDIIPPLSDLRSETDRIDARLAAPQSSIDVTGLRDALRRNQDSLDRLSKVVGGFQNFSRPSTEAPLEFVAVKDIVRETLDLCRTRFEKSGVLLEYPTLSNLDLSIRCRRSQLTQALVNLLNNGLDAVANTTDPWVLLEVEESVNRVYFKVIDSGLGVAQEIRASIFEPFFTTKNRQGTGLGLAIARNLVESQGGQVWLNENSPNTCFVIEIPKVETTA